MQKICTECNHLGKEYRNNYLLIIVVLFLFFIGLEFLVGLYKTSILIVIASLIWIGFGIYSLKIFLDKPDCCPNCKKKRTMIPLDTPKAEQLIKENNLTIPEDLPEESSPQST